MLTISLITVLILEIEQKYFAIFFLLSFIGPWYKWPPTNLQTCLSEGRSLNVGLLVSRRESSETWLSLI